MGETADGTDAPATITCRLVGDDLSNVQTRNVEVSSWLLKSHVRGVIRACRLLFARFQVVI
jgi:hypothetical protein